MLKTVSVFGAARLADFLFPVSGNAKLRPG